MIRYNKILVPYDNSKLSHIALDHAMTIAKMSSISSSKQIVNIILFYVTPIIHTPFTIETISLKSEKTGETIPLHKYIKELHQEIKSNAIKMLNEKIKEYENVENVSLHSKVTIGEPADEIIKFTSDKKIDLIIMGTTGFGGIKKFVFGSVARNVSEKASCSVMLVRWWLDTNITEKFLSFLYSMITNELVSVSKSSESSLRLSSRYLIN